MATTNVLLTTSWKRIVTIGADFLVSFPAGASGSIEVATCDRDEDPVTGVSGHTLSAALFDAITRQILGGGYVYARSTSGSVTIVLSIR